MYAELFKATVTIAGNYNITPFEVMAQDTDEVIMLINFLLDMGSSKEESKPQVKKQKDNFWDF